MESHESAGILEEEYVSLRRRHMWRRGVLAGSMFAFLQLGSSIRQLGSSIQRLDSKGWHDLAVDMILLPLFAALFGWFIGYCSWGPEKEKVLAEYKKRIQEPVRRVPIGKSNKAPLETVYTSLSGICWLVLYLHFFHHTLAEFFVPAFVVEVVMILHLYLVLRHEDEIYQAITTRPTPEFSFRREIFSSWWVWALLLLTFFWGSARVLIPALIFAITFFPIHKRLVLRSWREFGEAAETVSPR